MLDLNNNVKFVDFKNFWAGVDEVLLKNFALNFNRSSFTAFKVKFEILLETHLDKAKAVYSEFEQFCKDNNYNLNEDFKKKVTNTFAPLKEANEQAHIVRKFSLTKWKNKRRRKMMHIKEEEHER